MGHRRRRKRTAIETHRERAADPFDHLPDELVLAIASALGDIRALACLARTCRRMHCLATDSHVWRPLYVVAHGPHSEPPLRFLEFGKDWRWAYRASLPISHRQRRTRTHSVGRIAQIDKGLVYRGDFKRTHRHGYGHMACKDGSSYNGQWLENRRHGEGTYVWPGGVRYDGGWMNDRMHGHGVIRYNDGHAYSGTWASGEFTGIGVHVFPDGRSVPCRREGMDWYDVVVPTEEDLPHSCPDSIAGMVASYSCCALPRCCSFCHSLVAVLFLTLSHACIL
jgi:hypothetical protein